jgi:NADP-dependent 3-hydroxy acid dehydrogenase YdfG
MAKRLLDGTVALVTGASSGIGEATARALAAQGAAVALAARREERLEQLAQDITRSGGHALAIEADVTDKAQAQAAVARTVAEWRRLDILVNNAGVGLLGPIENAPLDDWDQMVRVNLLGVLYTTHAALPHLLQAAERAPRRVADLVTISSVAGRIATSGSGV